MKKSLIFFIVLTAGITMYATAQKKGQELIDSLLVELPNAKDDTAKAKMLDDISWEYQYIDPEKGIEYGVQEFELAQKMNWMEGISVSGRTVANNYRVKDDYHNALDYDLKSLHAAIAIGNKRGAAISYNAVGDDYRRLSNYPMAIENFFHSLKGFEELGEKGAQAWTCSNIVIVYILSEDYSKALEYQQKALQLNEEMGDSSQMANDFNQFGLIYRRQENYDKALEYNLKALVLHERLGDKTGAIGDLNNIGLIYDETQNYSQALEYYSKALKENEAVGNKNWTAVNLTNIGKIYLMIVQEENDSARASLNQLCAGNKTVALKKAKTFTESALAINKSTGSLLSISNNYKQLSDIQSLLGDDTNALDNYKNYSTLKDSIFNIEKDKKITQTTMQYEFDKKEAAQKAEQEKKDIQQRNIRIIFILITIGIILLSIGLYSRLRYVRRSKKILQIEKDRSDELLLNILPAETAEELKNTGSTKAKDFTEVTVLFTDFKNFTLMSERLSAQELVNEINYCYSAFDTIITKHNIEKIKTIGDSYMCAGGLPVANKTNAFDTVKAAIDIRDFMLQEKQKREKDGLPYCKHSAYYIPQS
ncbi:MAG: tetratricopeptide repeat protein [Bacteroidales bacterium]|nr:tetratricopeptide repeat protein [Bacteroidales bacterium]MCF8458076.1 tetratricopeptide repeat protein [Bacteroidales bacterium]